MKLISVDIGSTFTKAASFLLKPESGGKQKELELIRHSSVPTTNEDLFSGFKTVLENLCRREFEKIDSNDFEIFLSSSAHGGLSIAAIGIVPEMTLKMAHLTALSAGGKITSLFSYKLTTDDIKKLEIINPDIILFTGGTNGGNEVNNLLNAKAIAESQIISSIIYAGNNRISDEINQILNKKDVIIAENILPEIDTPNPEDARRRIRDLFLSKITSGKGLGDIVRWTKNEPQPTPYSIYEYIKYFSLYLPEWKDFCVVDMGGATTDFYSSHKDIVDPAETILRGIKDPDVKRSVEGDLGMRISAPSVPKTADDKIKQQLEFYGVEETGFHTYLNKVSINTDYISRTETDRIYDKILAAVCVSVSAERHAGRVEIIYTANGPVRLQRGKDLSGVVKIIGTGGFLSSQKDFYPFLENTTVISGNGKEILIPRKPEYYVDGDYLFPMLANIGSKYSKEAVRYGVGIIKKVMD